MEDLGNQLNYKLFIIVHLFEEMLGLKLIINISYMFLLINVYLMKSQFRDGTS